MVTGRVGDVVTGRERDVVIGERGMWLQEESGMR